MARSDDEGPLRDDRIRANRRRARRKHRSSPPISFGQVLENAKKFPGLDGMRDGLLQQGWRPIINGWGQQQLVPPPAWDRDRRMAEPDPEDEGD